MLRAALCVAAFAGASAGAVELTKSNFDAEVKNSGKNAFIKFLACARRRKPEKRQLLA